MKKRIVSVTAVLVLALIPLAFAEKEYNEHEIASLVEEGRIDEAGTILEEHLSQNAKDVSAMALLGDIYRQKGDKKRAQQYLARAIALYPGYPAAHLYLGKLYFSMRKFDESAAEFDKFSALIGSFKKQGNDKQFYIEGLHYIGNIYLELKDYVRSRIVFEQILSFDPEDVYAIYNLGVYYYMYERNRSKAYQRLTKVIEIEPNTALAKKARYAIEFMRANPDPRIVPDFSFIDDEFRD